MSSGRSGRLIDVLLTLCDPVQSLGVSETKLVWIDGMVGY